MKEIVIELSDANYKAIMENRFEISVYAPIGLTVSDAIRNGILLPKGHGRLIDADTLADGFEDNYEFCEALNATPTLVEADKGDTV